MGEHNSGGKRHLYPDEAKGRRILALLNGKEILEPGPDFVPRNSRVGERKYHIGNIDYRATESELREFFSSVGPIVELHLFRDAFNNQSRGFAVLRCVGDAFALNGAMFQGRELRIDRWDRD